MTDDIDRLIVMRERLDELMQGETERKEKLGRLEKDVALASALAALKAASTDCRHERVRSQVNGAREQIRKVLAA